jgi:hypothetical protein
MSNAKKSSVEFGSFVAHELRNIAHRIEGGEISPKYLEIEGLDGTTVCVLTLEWGWAGGSDDLDSDI